MDKKMKGGWGEEFIGRKEGKMAVCSFSLSVFPCHWH